MDGTTTFFTDFGAEGAVSRQGTGRCVPGMFLRRQSGTFSVEPGSRDTMYLDFRPCGGGIVVSDDFKIELMDGRPSALSRFGFSKAAQKMTEESESNAEDKSISAAGGPTANGEGGKKHLLGVLCLHTAFLGPSSPACFGAGALGNADQRRFLTGFELQIHFEELPVDIVAAGDADADCGTLRGLPWRRQSLALPAANPDVRQASAPLLCDSAPDINREIVANQRPNQSFSHAPSVENLGSFGERQKQAQTTANFKGTPERKFSPVRAFHSLHDCRPGIDEQDSGSGSHKTRMAVAKTYSHAGSAKRNALALTLQPRLAPWFHRDVEWELVQRFEAAAVQPSAYGSSVLLCAHGALLRGLLLVEAGRLRLRPPERMADTAFRVEEGARRSFSNNADDTFHCNLDGLGLWHDQATVLVGTDDLAGEMAVLFPQEQVHQVHCHLICPISE